MSQVRPTKANVIYGYEFFLNFIIRRFLKVTGLLISKKSLRYLANERILELSVSAFKIRTWFIAAKICFRNIFAYR